MFSLAVDDDLALTVVQHNFAKPYALLVQQHYTDLCQWLTWPPFCRTEADCLTYIQKHLHEFADYKSLLCGILYQGELVGGIGYYFMDHQVGKLQIGYWLAPPYRGQGLAARACYRMIHYALHDLGMNKVEVRCATENKASRALCERLGLPLEGISRCAENIHGRLVDHAIYAAFHYTPLKPPQPSPVPHLGTAP